ncbi:MAG: YfhO family protein [Candidatus Omnitrophota bacterium]|jgi:hypothetical protein
MSGFLKTDYFKAGVIYFVLICAVYSPVVFFGKTISASARFPWFNDSPPAESYVMPREYPNTMNVDIAHPAASEDPMDLFIGRQIRKGVFPLWNPFIGCGTVIIDQFSNRSLFPYQLIQDISPWSWRDFFMLGRLFIAAAGVFMFLKLLGTGFYTSLYGGIIYVFSGAMTVFLPLTEMSNIAMMMPYVLLGPELINRYRGIRSAALNSLAASFMMLGGQPEVSFYGIVLSVAFFSFKIVTGKERMAVSVNKSILFAVSLAVALLISSPFFVPFLMNIREYYTLHTPGGSMGIETPTPAVNYVAAFLPEMLRWRSVVTSFTTNAGWDSLGGYIGVSGVFIILTSFGKKWERRKDYLFFLFFSAVILLKNTGFPLVSWIGRLPLFDQVWTPRWAGPAWNLSLAICAALGFEGAILTSHKVKASARDRGLRGWYLLLLSGFLAISLGVLINPLLLLIVAKPVACEQACCFSALAVIRALFVAAGMVILLKCAKRFGFGILFVALSLAVVVCVVNFQGQLQHISFPGVEYHTKNIFVIKDKLVLFSMWQGMLESLFVGLAVVFALSAVLRKKDANRPGAALLALAVIAIEMSFHVTLGYGELGRSLRFVVHLSALSAVILCAMPYDNGLFERKGRFLVGSFFMGMLIVGAIGSGYLPRRGKDLFMCADTGHKAGSLSRIMAIKGLAYPNLAVVGELQDVRSIVPISIRRFQLFQDYCLSARPQGKYKSLWFTGIIDPYTGKGISEHLRERHLFYSLAGVSNYLSPDYEDIPYTRLVYDGDFKNYRNLSVMPRAFLVYNWSIARDPESALAWMLSNASFLASRAVVEDTGTCLSVAGNHLASSSSNVEIKEYTPHSILIETEAEAPGLLILTDTYHPDWTVTVNGKKEMIVPADLCFRGVFLKPGVNKVRFTYFPKVFYVCIALSFMALFVVFLFILMPSPAKGRKNG